MIDGWIFLCVVSDLWLFWFWLRKILLSGEKILCSRSFLRKRFWAFLIASFMRIISILRNISIPHSFNNLLIFHIPIRLHSYIHQHNQQQNHNIHNSFIKSFRLFFLFFNPRLLLGQPFQLRQPHRSHRFHRSHRVWSGEFSVC